MKHLIFYSNGILKSFAINKPELIIGRHRKCDLTIDDVYVSNSHLKVINNENNIKIFDLNSKNGSFINNIKISESEINIGESFYLANNQFILKKGNPKDFEISDEIKEVIKKIEKENKENFLDKKTEYSKDVLEAILKNIIKHGLAGSDFSSILMEITYMLNNLSWFGGLFIVNKTEKKTSILFSINKKRKLLSKVNKIIKKNNDIFKKEITLSEWIAMGEEVYSKPVNIKAEDHVMLYFPRNVDEFNDKMYKFLNTLCSELSFLSKITKKNGQKKDDNEIITSNEDLKNLIKLSKKISKGTINVLIQGENGIGKELFARLIHNSSKRKDNNYVALNCAAMPDSLLESELFGHEKGAFTDAFEKKKGKLELASGGTLILDEIGDMPLNLQAKLLRVLQEEEFYPIGSNKSVKVDLRLISMTNKNISEMVKNNEFREDLYFRIVHREINIPPLRDRKDDIILLVNHFTDLFCNIENKSIKGYSVKVLEILKNHYWQGNIRQLKNEIKTIISIADDGDTINSYLLSENIKNYKPKTQTISIDIPLNKENEIKNIINILNKHDWNKTHAAKELGITYRGLHKKMKRLGINKN